MTQELADLHKERQAVAALLGCLPGDRIPVGGTSLQDRARAVVRRVEELEALVSAQAKVIATGEAYLECDGSPAELAAFYDEAKAELAAQVKGLGGHP